MTMRSCSPVYTESRAVSETRALAAELCCQFYALGWVFGTGGSIAIKARDDSVPRSHQLIVMSPSGVQKERMLPEDMFILSSDGTVLSSPLPRPYSNKPPKCTDSSPLFMKVFEMLHAGAVVHSHGIESCLVTMINPSQKEFRIKHMEMIKGIPGHGFHDELVVPIIENTAHESELLESFGEAIKAYPKTTAVLVRNHGVYVWGNSWASAKTQLLCPCRNLSLSLRCCHQASSAGFRLFVTGSSQASAIAPGAGDLSQDVPELDFSLQGCIAFLLGVN